MPQTLQEEIKQTRPFARPEFEALVSVMRTAAVLDHALGDALRPYGLTRRQYNVLRILRGAGEAGLCGRDIGERLVDIVPDVPRLLARLEALGLISRARGPHDRRHVTARLTAMGRELLEQSTPCLNEIALQRFARLDEEVTRALIDGLAVVREHG
ncbi:MAG: MarR family transcriptional regulator [Gemmatimonadetes bacterium]|nr:MarR family transcriptional regulator [Gemmatimonadota bacterium]